MTRTIIRDGNTYADDTIVGVFGIIVLASGLGNKNGASKEKKRQTAEDKRDDVTFALLSVKHAATHKSRIGDKKNPNNERKEPRQVEPPDASIHTRTEGATVQLCGDSSAAEK